MEKWLRTSCRDVNHAACLSCAVLLISIVACCYGLLANQNKAVMYRSPVYNKAEEVVAVWVYLPQFDAHDHPQLSIWYQGADWGLTG